MVASSGCQYHYIVKHAGVALLSCVHAETQRWTRQRHMVAEDLCTCNKSIRCSEHGSAKPQRAL